MDHITEQGLAYFIVPLFPYGHVCLEVCCGSSDLSSCESTTPILLHKTPDLVDDRGEASPLVCQGSHDLAGIVHSTPPPLYQLLEFEKTKVRLLQGSLDMRNAEVTNASMQTAVTDVKQHCITVVTMLCLAPE